MNNLPIGVNRGNHTAEIRRRIRMGWAAFQKPRCAPKTKN